MGCVGHVWTVPSASFLFTIVGLGSRVSGLVVPPPQVDPSRATKKNRLEQYMPNADYWHANAPPLRSNSKPEACKGHDSNNYKKDFLNTIPALNVLADPTYSTKTQNRNPIPENLYSENQASESMP